MLAATGLQAQLWDPSTTTNTTGEIYRDGKISTGNQSGSLYSSWRLAQFNSTINNNSIWAGFIRNGGGAGRVLRIKGGFYNNSHAIFQVEANNDVSDPDEYREANIRFRVTADGNVSIGPDAPSFKLHLQNGDFAISSNGTNNFLVTAAGYVRAREIKVDLYPIPDYVFDAGYQLMSLPALRAYIAANKHLPGVPSAAEYGAEEGIELGKLQMTLLEKVEELTLYLLELEQRNAALEQEVANIKNSIGK